MADPKKSYNDIITWAKGTSNDIIAKQLATARTISITNNSGTALASGTFNGTGNLTLKLPATVGIDISGNAATATKLGTTNKGSATQPIYLNAGVPTAVGSSLAVSVTGNAATATKLKTARNIALTGAVTGNGNFDGSGNLSIATLLSQSGKKFSIKEARVPIYADFFYPADDTQEYDVKIINSSWWPLIYFYTDVIGFLYVPWMPIENQSSSNSRPKKFDYMAVKMDLSSMLDSDMDVLLPVRAQFEDAQTYQNSYSVNLEQWNWCYALGRRYLQFDLWFKTPYPNSFSGICTFGTLVVCINTNYVQPYTWENENHIVNSGTYV